MAEDAIRRSKERIKLLDTFTVEVAARIPKIRHEMATLQPEDYERGWADAFGNEFESLNQQLGMAKEEMRCIRAKIMRQRNEITILWCELEECEAESDHLAVTEAEAWEGLRRASVGRIERRVDDVHRRAIRVEKCKWKTEAVRLNVIRRNRAGYQEIVAKAREGRDLGYVRTVSYEKRRQRRDLEELREQKMHEEDGRNAALLSKTYETYAQPLQETYDSVVTSTLDLLRGVTLDERANRLKGQFAKRAIDKKKMLGGQFAPLKKTEDLVQAFDYLKKA